MHPLKACLLLLFAVVSFADDAHRIFDGKSLDGWTVAPFGGHGDVEVRDGVIVLNQGILTGVNYTKPTPNADYEVSLEARKTLGSDFFCGLTFPVGNAFCTWIVGGWGGAVVGLSSINDEDASHNETTSYRRFDTGIWYKLKIRVTLSRITAWIDGEQVIDANTQGKTISLRPGEIETSKPFGLAAWNTSAELRNIELRSLKDAPAVGESDTSKAPQLPEAIARDLDRIVAATTNTPAAWQRLAEMCDRFGPRFSGSTNLETAIDWILAQMRDEGLDNVHGEKVMVPHWIRGAESCELSSPVSETIAVIGLGGTIATPPEGVEAPVFVVKSFADLSNHTAEARGKIVLFNAPFTKYGETVNYRYSGAIEAAKAGAVASIIRSITPYSLETPHTGMMHYDTNVPPIPHAAITIEDAERLARWQARGVTPVVRLKLSGSFGPEAESRNVVGEIRGREKPEEVIVMGGHIDSWDVGRGAMDDGGGCLAAWEALRVIKQLGLRPRRTIRVVLWTNEENGMRGSKGYHYAHLAELSNHVAAIESDGGAFAPKGFGFSGSAEARASFRPLVSYLGSRVKAGLFSDGGGDSDTDVLVKEGVPGLSLQTANERYFWFHHTAADNPERLDPKDLAKCAAAFACVSYWLAESETRLPR